jgi:hypothetical protein
MIQCLNAWNLRSTVTENSSYPGLTRNLQSRHHQLSQLNCYTRPLNGYSIDYKSFTDFIITIYITSAGRKMIEKCVERFAVIVKDTSSHQTHLSTE